MGDPHARGQERRNDRPPRVGEPCRGCVEDQRRGGAGSDGRTGRGTAACGADVAGSAVCVTDAGSELHERIRSAVVEITHRMWGDLPADDLAATGRVLTTVLERANAELARA